MHSARFSVKQKCIFILGQTWYLSCSKDQETQTGKKIYFGEASNWKIMLAENR